MSITYTVLDFPNIGIKGQVFYCPGSYVEGGITSGGAVVSTFEPGGYGMLDIAPARRDESVADPEISWLMSQTNGQIFRVALTATPQLLTERTINDRAVAQYPTALFTKRSLRSTFTDGALKGGRTVKIDTSEIGPSLKRGHLIGHDNSCYMVDSVTYVTSGEATVIVSPPLRSAVAIDDVVRFTPFFTGQIINGSEIRASYDSANNGAIDMPVIRMREVIL